MLVDERQRARLCRAVLAPVFRDRSPALFSDRGPTPRAWDLFDADGGPLSTTERALLLTSFAIWRGAEDGPPVGVLLHRLGRPAARRVATVMALLCASASEIEQWLARAEAADGFTRHLRAPSAVTLQKRRQRALVATQRSSRISRAGANGAFSLELFRAGENLRPQARV